MGVYASTANTRKVSEDGVLGDLAYGVSEMQGWRKTMEDTHIAARVEDLLSPTAAEGGGDTLVFGVFDGHGGREVAHFCKEHFVAELPGLEGWLARDFGELLRGAFLRMDELLREPAHQAELARLKTRTPGESTASSGSNDSGRLPPADGSVAAVDGDVADGLHVGDGGGGRADGTSLAIEEAAQMLRAVLAMKRAVAPRAAPAADGGGAALTEATAPGAASVPPLLLPARGAAPANRTPPFASPPQSVQVNAGCTAIVACVHGRTLWVANAGDSRAVLCRGGRAMELSRDHKPTQQAEHDRIVRAGGWVTDAGRVNGNLNLSRSIGDLKYKGNSTLPPDEQIITAAPEVMQVPLESGDEFMVLACDGVWDCKSNEETVAFVRARLERKLAPALSAIAEELFDECVSRDPTETAGIGADNMTCIIVDLRRAVQ